MEPKEKVTTISAKSASRFFYIVGTITLVLTAFFFVNKIMILRHSVATEARVSAVSVYRTCGHNSGCGYQSRVVLDFKTEQGNSVQVKGDYAHIYHVGDSINILYDKENPQTFFVNRFDYLWSFYVIFLILGIISISLGIFISTKGNKKVD